MRINSINNVSNSHIQYNDNYKNKTKPVFCAKGIYSGSFDPITKGHMDIIKRANKL